MPADQLGVISVHEALLHQLYAIPGVTASRSYVVLSTYLERPAQAEVTEAWPPVAMTPA